MSDRFTVRPSDEDPRFPFEVWDGAEKEGCGVFKLHTTAVGIARNLNANFKAGKLAPKVKWEDSNISRITPKEKKSFEKLRTQAKAK